ncbi:MAG: helix-hairpin-helix domain-containing protein [Xanthomonadaceae bacterium]|jgi:hypothetical protein|nr:helix-hairpin-helix domain-containing protein [Xanthomonadaceae bacterium]
MRKAPHIDHCRRLEEIPNIGPAMAGDLRLLGIHAPRELAGRDPLALYRALCAATGVRQDPCVLDTFIAAVRFAEGGPALRWWRFTAERKERVGSEEWRMD